MDRANKSADVQGKSISMSKEDIAAKVDGMIAQYRRYYTEWINYNQSIWQLPSVLIAISGVLIGLSYHIPSSTIRRCLILLTTIWVGTMIFALIKHRFFQESRNYLIEQIENELKKLGIIDKTTPTETKELIKLLEYNEKEKNRKILLFKPILSLSAFWAFLVVSLTWLLFLIFLFVLNF